MGSQLVSPVIAPSARNGFGGITRTGRVFSVPAAVLLLPRENAWNHLNVKLGLPLSSVQATVSARRVVELVELKPVALAAEHSVSCFYRVPVSGAHGERHLLLLVAARFWLSAFPEISNPSLSLCGNFGPLRGFLPFSCEDAA